MAKGSTNRYENAIRLAYLLHLLPERYFIHGKMAKLNMEGDFVQYKYGRQIVFEVKNQPIGKMIEKALDFFKIKYQTR